VTAFGWRDGCEPTISKATSFIRRALPCHASTEAARPHQDPGLYVRFGWEYARHDPHKPHRDVALRALRFAHEESSVPLNRHPSNKSPLDGEKIIHTRSCNRRVPLKYNVAGTVARKSGG
jgi:hypothetical protein